MKISDNIEKHIKLVSSINEQIDSLLEQNDRAKEYGAEVSKMRQDLIDIKRKLGQLNTSSYSYIEIYFPNTTEIELGKYGSEDIKRKLEGRMYFKVKGINENVKYMDIQTKSLKDRFWMRLYYQTLDKFVRQTGKIQLVYISGRENLKSEPESINFEIKSLK